MGQSRALAEQNRERVVGTASRLFREHGFHGVGVADIMNEAGLTHGGFYKQFESKDALAAEACAVAFDDSIAWRSPTTGLVPHSPGALLTNYLSKEHRDAPDRGCPAAAFASEVFRAPQAVQAAFTAGLAHIVGAIADSLAAATGQKPRAARQQAILAASAAIGAVALARAVESTDPAFSDEILDSVRRAILAR
jgi:TetR/AcrR family transcriptional repressor of nem operon